MSHILIIEDEPMIALSIEMALEDAGATSFEIVDSEEDAIVAARRHHPDLITSDVKLRMGTGPKAVQAIREEQGDTPVIFLTGSPADCEPCNPPGIILTKPFDHSILIAAYRQATA